MAYNPLISIIIPVYNTKRYLDETIGSVLKQTFSNWELILVDDGSTDGSVDLIQCYCQKDARMKLVQQPNAGQGAARNNGVQQASGELIAFLDSDDLWVPEKLAKQLEEKVQHGVQFQYAHGYLMHEDQNNEITTYDWIAGKFEGLAFFNELFISCQVNTDTVLMDKSIFDQIGYFDTGPELRGTEDFDMWLKVGRAGFKIFGSKERVAYYRIHPGGTHLNTMKQNIGRIKIFAKHIGDKSIHKRNYLKSFRYFIRELLDQLNKKGNSEIQIRQYLSLLKQADRRGVVTNIQVFLSKFISPAAVIQLSNLVIYRIGYRIESLFSSLYL